jgi:hypothetical protein
VKALSRYVFSVLREGDALYRGSGASLEPILLGAPVGEHAAHESRPMAGMTLVLARRRSRDPMPAQGAGRAHPGAARRERDEASRDDRRGAPLGRISA